MAKTARTAPIPQVAAPVATIPTLIPITEWPSRHPWPPVGGLRWLNFHADTNGFASAFVRVGARVLVDEAEFFRCVQRGNASAKRQTRRLPRSLPKPVAVPSEIGE